MLQICFKTKLKSMANLIIVCDCLIIVLFGWPFQICSFCHKIVTKELPPFISIDVVPFLKANDGTCSYFQINLCRL
jgi:hypothetical protein